jgi:hypothetical protein
MPTNFINEVLNRYKIFSFRLRENNFDRFFYWEEINAFAHDRNCVTKRDKLYESLLLNCGNFAFGRVCDN